MAEIPTNNILEMQNSGMNDAQIISKLRESGFSEKDINDAFNQAKIKDTIKPAEFNQSVMQNQLPKQPTQKIPSPPQQNYSEEITKAPSPSQDYTSNPYDAQQYEYQDYPEYQQQDTAISSNAFEELAESIIEERWRTFEQKIGDLQGWKERTEENIERIEKRIDKIDNAMNGIQAALLDKVSEYGRNVKNVGSDVKAVEKVLSQIMEPLLNNVKELKEISNSLKKKKH